MRIKRRPLWMWIGSVYALATFASAAAIALSNRSTGLGN